MFRSFFILSLVFLFSSCESRKSNSLEMSELKPLPAEPVIFSGFGSSTEPYYKTIKKISKENGYPILKNICKNEEEVVYFDFRGKRYKGILSEQELRNIIKN